MPAVSNCLYLRIHCKACESKNWMMQQNNNRESKLDHGSKDSGKERSAPQVSQGDRCSLRERDAHTDCPGQQGRTWEMSITASQLRGRAEVRSLKPSRVEMIPFWSILRIMVPSTKKITPYLSTVMPADKKLPNGQRWKISIGYFVYHWLNGGQSTTKWQLSTFHSNKD